MFKRLLILPIAVLSVLSASAQLRYTLKDTTTAYTRLTGATSLNGSLVWDEEILYAPMPFTWTIDGNKSVNYFYLALEIPGVVADTNSFGSLDGFFLSDVDIADRGTISGATLSPIRYLTTGTAPNRIFKLEIANAGFFVEYGDHGSMDDSVDMQIWVYETSNIVEYHYGPSKITYPSEYYGFGGSGPVPGYAKGLNFVSGTSGSFYYLTGNPATATLDSVTLPGTGGFPTGLSAWPASGQVYRFTPKSTGGVGVANATAHKLAVRVYPSLATSTLNVQYLPDAPETADYQISSVAGAVIRNGQLHAGVQRIDISTIAAGTYYLQVKSRNGSGNYVFVKQ